MKDNCYRNALIAEVDNSPAGAGGDIPLHNSKH